MKLELEQAAAPELLAALAKALGAGSQAALARALGVTQPAVSQWVTGVNQMPAPVRKLACRLIAEAM